MRAHYLQHLPTEGLGSIEPWLNGARDAISCIPFDSSTKLLRIKVLTRSTLSSLSTDKKTMTRQTNDPPETNVSCAQCEACCCRQEAMLFGDAEVPDDLTVINPLGKQSMARLADGWCVALDRKTKRCTIYDKRPWICREFEMGGDECLAARAEHL